MTLPAAKPAAVALACSAGLAIAAPALAKGERDAFVACAWSRVPTTAAALVARAKFDRRYVYEADGGPTVGGLMRVYAACEAEKIAYFADPARRNDDTRAFLQRLKATKPTTIAPDAFVQPVFRCEFRFTDWANAIEPAAVGWAFGPEGAEHQLAANKTVFGTRGTIDAADLENNAKMTALLAEAQQQSLQAVEVSSYAEGQALNRPFVVGKNGQRTCKRVMPSGEFENA